MKMSLNKSRRQTLIGTKVKIMSHASPEIRGRKGVIDDVFGTMICLVVGDWGRQYVEVEGLGALDKNGVLIDRGYWMNRARRKSVIRKP